VRLPISPPPHFKGVRKIKGKARIRKHAKLHPLTIHFMISAVKGDITKMHVDAIVNAANSSLLGGGGVDGAIHRAGGPSILEACKEIVAKQGGCKTGDAVITTAGNLPAKYVIHTVGPVWHGGRKGEPALLENAYRNSMKLAVQNKCKSIAFPAISTGVYGYPKEQAASTAVQTVHQFIETLSEKPDVVFCCFDDENYQLVTQKINAILKV
jgi:O-acetyl-ADP-ribose deacetylase (regulator of RNase III)